MPELVRTTVAAVSPEAADQLRLLVVDPDRFVDGHTRPGQYCHMRVPGGPSAFYALLSTPAEQELAFLVKAAGSPGTEIAALRPGDALELSPPEGPGFDVDAAQGRDVVFVATGTGIAPVRAVIEDVLRRRDAFGALTLYYGVRGPPFIALSQHLERWRAAGVEVRVTFSQDAPREEGARGYVQELILADRPDLGNAALFAAGQEALLEDLAASVAHLGGTRDWILQNI